MRVTDDLVAGLSRIADSYMQELLQNKKKDTEGYKRAEAFQNALTLLPKATSSNAAPAAVSGPVPNAAPAVTTESVKSEDWVMMDRPADTERTIAFLALIDALCRSSSTHLKEQICRVFADTMPEEAKVFKQIPTREVADSATPDYWKYHDQTDNQYYKYKKGELDPVATVRQHIDTSKRNLSQADSLSYGQHLESAMEKMNPRGAVHQAILDIFAKFKPASRKVQDEEFKPPSPKSPGT